MNLERDEVLWRFVEETGAAPESVKEWAKRYPEYADDLIALSLYRDIVPVTSEEEKAEFSRAAALPETGRPAAGTLVSAMRARHAAAAIPSIVEIARSRGFAPRELAARLRIGFSVLTRIERRLLDPSSVPATLIRRLAEALGVSADSVWTYLQQPPTLSPAASYRAKVRPNVGAVAQTPMWYTARLGLTRALPSWPDEDDTQASDAFAGEVSADLRQDFVEAVRAASDMDDADKAFWLSQRGSDVDGA